MSTYWYIDLDAALAVPADEANERFERAMSGLGHHLHDGEPSFATLVTDGLPFHADTGLAPIGDPPPSGWRIEGERLRARLFVENLNRVADDGASRTHDPMLACLSAITAGPAGVIVGAMANENDDCMGPLVRVGDVVRWFPSPACDPNAGWESSRSLPSIDRVPEDLLVDPGNGFTCDVDVDELVVRLERTKSRADVLEAEPEAPSRT